MTKAVILGTGSCLPAKALTNAELEQIVDTSDSWIFTRTGIRERRIAGPGEEIYKIAAQAGKNALDAAGLKPDQIELLIVATVSSYMTMPATACFVQTALGAEKAFAFDISAACAGFTYGVDIASKYISARPGMKVLVIGAENLSTRLNWQDRNTCVLFGDGAGAAVLGSGQDRNRGILGTKLHTDGRYWNLLYTDGPKSMNSDLERPDWQGSYIQMNGSELFKHAVRLMETVVKELLAEHNLSINDVDLMIPHQANIRIINNLKDRLGVSEEKVFVNLSKYGNTSSASIPIALDEANRGGRLKEGDLVLMCTFGAGLAWGALLLRW